MKHCKSSEILRALQAFLSFLLTAVIYKVSTSREAGALHSYHDATMRLLEGVQQTLNSLSGTEAHV
jgi:hypothetical protein